MKRIFTLIAAVVLSAPLLGQSPARMSYQAVIRDAGNNLVNNQPIGIKVSILQGTDKGNTVFAEVFNPNPETNANGLLTIEIGGGDPVSGSFSDIDWSKGPYFIKTEVDPTGGMDYSIEGISQLLSVPFALHAKTVEVDKVDDADNDPFNEIQSLSINGSQLSLSKGGGTIDIPLPTGEATPNGPAGGDLAGNYPNPVIGDGKITSLKIAGNAVIEDKIASGAVTGKKIALAGASAGQVLKWNGTTWAPGTDEAGGFSLPYSGNVTSSGNAITIVNEGTGNGINASVSTGVGLYGRTNSTSGLGYGVFGSSGSSDGRGVYVEASSATGSSYGLLEDRPPMQAMEFLGGQPAPPELITEYQAFRIHLQALEFMVKRAVPQVPIMEFLPGPGRLKVAEFTELPRV